MIKNKIDWDECKNFSYIPENMKNKKQWVCWRVQEGKKIPYDAVTGRFASSADTSTWTSYHEAVKAKESRGFDGVGYEIVKGEVAIDLDHCYENGSLTRLAQNVLEHFLDTFAEISQSGNGIHIFCHATIPYSIKTAQIEIYGEKRYIATTFNAVSPCELKDKQDEIDTLWQWLSNKRERGRPGAGQRQLPQRGCTSMTATEIISKASASRGGDVFAQLYKGDWKNLGIGDGSQSSADLSFANKLCFWCAGDTALMEQIFRTSGMYRNYRKMNLAIGRAVRDCTEIYKASCKI